MPREFVLSGCLVLRDLGPASTEDIAAMAMAGEEKKEQERRLLGQILLRGCLLQYVRSSRHEVPIGTGPHDEVCIGMVAYPWTL